MPALDMLNVAIGIIFIYLLLSLICTAVNEIIENGLKNRAVNLEKGIRQLLQPQDTEGQDSLVKMFYKHPLISSLCKGPYTDLRNRINTKNLPSYIPAASFAATLVQLIVSHNPAKDKAGTDTAKETTPNATDKQIDTPALTVQSLQSALASWPYPHTQQVLLSLITGADNDINVVIKNIETWFNNSMDRVSGWYKRRVQRILVVIGFVLAGALNADSIAIFKSLVNDAPLRNALVAASQEYARSSAADSTKSPEARVNRNIQELNALQLPIGWRWKPDHSAVSNYSLAIPTGTGKDLAWNIVFKVLGIIITGFAVSLGAPFWFDTLNRVMVIRSTVKPHEKSPEEGSED